MMTLDMTAQFAPVAWGIIGLLFASAVGILTTALPRAGSKKQNATRPVRALRPVALPA